MKQHLLHVLRRTGLLGPADRAHAVVHRLRSAGANRAFRARYPDYPVPPVRLAFEAYGHTSWEEYHRTGEAHARRIVELIREHARAAPLDVAEWGCGCGRILRHLAAAGLDNVALSGLDADAEAIAWCRACLPGMDFRPTGTLPPLPYADGAFDVVYHYSVWTHLSDTSVAAWAAELARVLRPGGLMIGTTHGSRYQAMLLPWERARYSAGQPVSRRHYREGRKYYLSFHPPAFVRPVLEASFRQVHQRELGPDLPQDVWIGIK